MRVDSNQLITGACVVSHYAGHGVQAQNIPATGDSGPAFLYNDIAEHNFQPTDELRALIKSFPTNGVTNLNEDSSFTYTGPDGLEYIVYELLGNGASYGDYTVTLVTGTWETAVTGGIPSVTAAVGAAIVTGSNAANISAGIPAASAVVVASSSVPVFSATVSGGIPAIIAAASASTPVSGNAASVIGGIPAAVASVVAARTLPNYITTVSAGIPAVTASAIVINGQLVINIPPGNRVSLQSPSRFVALPAITV
jgi:hypothetical protein